MKKVWNIPLIWKIFKITIALAIFLFVLNSCDDSNPMSNEYNLMSMESGVTEDESPIPCCVYPPEDINLMMANEQEGNDLPWPMIVGGELLVLHFLFVVLLFHLHYVIQLLLVTHYCFHQHNELQLQPNPL